MTTYEYRLDQDQQLNTGDQLTSGNRDAYLILEADGNLVLYRAADQVALWASGTVGTAVTHAIMQSDGNFVCYDDAGRAYFATGTDGHPGSSLLLPSDGDLRIIAPPPDALLLWETRTTIHQPPFNIDTGDTHVDVGMWMHSSASYASGAMSGRTRTWSTILLTGFHGAVLPLVLDSDGLAMWPWDPDAQKHRYGVTGVWLGNHDRTDSWTNTVESTVDAEATSITCINFHDPDPGLNLNNVGIIHKTPSQILADIQRDTGLG